MDVGAFVAAHLQPVDEDLDSRLSPATPKTKALWRVCTSLLEKEYNSGGVLAVDTTKPSNITAFSPGYIDGDGSLDDVVVVGCVPVVVSPTASPEVGDDDGGSL